MKLVDTGVRFGYPTHTIFEPWGVELLAPMSFREVEEYLDNNKPDLALFGGGLDVNPRMYNQKNITSSCDGPQIKNRDLYESMLWRLFKSHGIPTLGICRGSQFTCVMSGGALYQDVTNHLNTHKIIMPDGEVYTMTSTHHQMMAPWKVEHEIIATPPKNLSDHYVFDVASGYEDPEVEPEIVFFPKTNALAIQGHPEYFEVDHPTVKMVRRLVNTKFFNGAMPNV